MIQMKFTQEHEWIAYEGTEATIGITDHAQQQLGDIVYVELPEIGQTLTAQENAGTIESVKAASEIYSPVSGEVIEINPALEASPETVNSDAEKTGWLFRMKLADLSELDALMSADSYQAFIAD